MISKNNKKLLDEKTRDEKQRFSIRKLSIGAASVLIGLTFIAYGGQSVSAATESGSGAAEVTSQDEATDAKAAVQSENDQGEQQQSAGQSGAGTTHSERSNGENISTLSEDAGSRNNEETKSAIRANDEKGVKNEKGSSNQKGEEVTTPASDNKAKVASEKEKKLLLKT